MVVSVSFVWESKAGFTINASTYTQRCALIKAGLTSWPLFFFFDGFGQKITDLLGHGVDVLATFGGADGVDEGQLRERAVGRRHAHGPVVVQLLEGRGGSRPAFAGCRLSLAARCSTAAARSTRHTPSPQWRRHAAALSLSASTRGAIRKDTGHEPSWSFTYCAKDLTGTRSPFSSTFNEPLPWHDDDAATS